MLQNTARSGSRSPYLGVKTRRRRKTSKEERICPVCSQTFKKAEHLARHIRSHTKERPFQCVVCQKAFARQDTLLRHSRSHSSNEIGDGLEMGCEFLGGCHGDEKYHGALPQPPLDLTGTMLVPVSPPSSASIDQPTPSYHVPGSDSYQAQTTPLAPLFSLEPGSRDYRLDSDWETLLTGDDFDLDAVNVSLLHATSDILPSIDVPDIPSLEHHLSNVDENARQRASSVQQNWHTYSDTGSSSGHITPDSFQSGQIDESYRRKLCERLQPRVQHGILPSTQFLDLCIQAYFSKFHPLFPVVHIPTFRPGIQNSILLLSICSVGSLCIGSTRALSHGISMFERLNKAILASWENYLSKPGPSSTIALQATLIGQTFGLLMGRPKDLLGIDVFHGSIIAWARNAKSFLPKHSDQNVLGLEGSALDDAWAKWIKDEVNMRIVLGLYIHDAELAKLHHHEPILRHSLDRLPQISSHELFTAPTATSWKILMIKSQSQHQHQLSPTHSLTPDFALIGMLESISALASESVHNLQDCHSILKIWYTHHNPIHAPWQSLLILWHSIFITLHADLDILESALGRDGYESSQNSMIHVREWLHSPDAKRCLLHAMIIQKHFESIPTGAESAVYLPLALYHVGIIWACFMYFEGNESLTLGVVDHLQFEELQLAGVGVPVELDGVVSRRLALGSVLRVVALLQRVGHWKISQSLASTLLAIVETQEFF